MRGIIACGLICFFLANSPLHAQTPSALPNIPIPKRLLVIAPHPDDVLLSAGLVFRVRKQGGQVRVVDLTCGDSTSELAFKYIARKNFNAHPQQSINYGYFRQTEDRAANAYAGGHPEDLIFLGYPDGGLWEIFTRSVRGDTRPVQSVNTGVSAVPYDNAWLPGAPYTYGPIIDSLAKQISQFKPDMIVTTHPNDNHSDHAAAFYLTTQVQSGIPIYTPLDEYAYTMPKTLVRNQRFSPPTSDAIPSPTEWFELELSPQEITAKIRMTSFYPSQMVWEHPTVEDYHGTRSYMYGYIGQNELYGRVLEARENSQFRENLNRRTRLSRALAVIGNVLDDWLRLYAQKN